VTVPPRRRGGSCPLSRRSLTRTGEPARWCGLPGQGRRPGDLIRRKGANPNRISSSGRGRPDRFSLDERPGSVRLGRCRTVVNCNPNCNPLLSLAAVIICSGPGITLACGHDLWRSTRAV
jgi:hypothetical protein